MGLLREFQQQLNYRTRSDVAACLSCGLGDKGAAEPTEARANEMLAASNACLTIERSFVEPPRHLFYFLALELCSIDLRQLGFAPNSSCSLSTFTEMRQCAAPH